MAIIRDGSIQEDDFSRVSDDATIPVAGNLIVSLKRFQKESHLLEKRDGKLGVILPSDQGPEELDGVLDGLALIAVEFPKFADGRGFSTGRLLRERLGFRGELRAIGNVLRDQLFYMKRCGFNAFEMTPGKDLNDALAAFGEYSVTYQGAADDPRPLFRRYARGPAA
jgi:uncharacterized protein (DUF934 family)